MQAPGCKNVPVGTVKCYLPAVISSYYSGIIARQVLQRAQELGLDKSWEILAGYANTLFYQPFSGEL